MGSSPTGGALFFNQGEAVVQVTMTLEEMIMASVIGCMRTCESRVNDRDTGTCDVSFDTDCYGAIAEYAYCKYRNVHWNGSIGSFKDADVGTAVQVRHTKLDHGCLIIRDNDDDNHYFILVTGTGPTFNIVGWLKGSDGKKREYCRAPNEREPAYFVVQERLHPFQPKEKKDAV